MIYKMVERCRKIFVPACDICDIELAPEYDFEDAVAAVRRAGWQTRRTGRGQYMNYCPRCAAAVTHAKEARRAAGKGEMDIE